MYFALKKICLKLTSGLDPNKERRELTKSAAQRARQPRDGRNQPQTDTHAYMRACSSKCTAISNCQRQCEDAIWVYPPRIVFTSLANPSTTGCPPSSGATSSISSEDRWKPSSVHTALFHAGLAKLASIHSKKNLPLPHASIGLFDTSAPFCGKPNEVHPVQGSWKYHWEPNQDPRTWVDRL